MELDNGWLFRLKQKEKKNRIKKSIFVLIGLMISFWLGFLLSALYTT